MIHSREIKIDSSRTRKLQLLAYNPKDRPRREQAVLTVRVSAKFGMITFNGTTIAELSMKDRFIKLYYDINQKIIAWKIKESVSQEELAMGWKLVKPGKKGQYPATIKTILSQMNLKRDSYKKLEVKKWKDYSLLSSDDYYYVEIK